MRISSKSGCLSFNLFSASACINCCSRSWSLLRRSSRTFALDLFKKDFGIEPKKTKSSSKPTRKSAADMVSTKTTTVEPKQEKVWSEREIAALSMAEFDKYEQEISDAMQEGRIVK